MDAILKIEEERALFEADAVPYGFDIARSKNVTGEPWCEYREIEAGHRWGGWLASAELAAQTLASKEAELAEAGLKYVSLFGELQNAMAEIERLKADAMRYRLLRMYKVHGYWPRELEHNPGILAFTAGYDDSRTYTLGRLDELLDEMLGVGITDELIKERGWRADYREYKAERARLVFSQVYSDAALTTTPQPTE